MGYRSTVSGSLRIEPGIPQRLLEGAGALSDYGDHPDASSTLLATTVDDSTVGMVDGQITVIGNDYTEVACRLDEEFKAYDFDSDVETFIKLVKVHSPSSTANGTLVVTGEGSGDIWRVRVEDNHVVTEHPKLVWPNGDEEEMGGH